MSTPEIIYRKSNFGIYDVNSLRIVECIYALQYSKICAMNYEKSYLIKNYKKPLKEECDFMKKVLDGMRIPLNVYWFNWCCYAAQNLLIYNDMPQPTSIITKIAEDTFGHKLEDKHIHTVNRLHRLWTYYLAPDKIFGVNVWQIMSIVDNINRNSIKNNENSIILLFNKIYKREPNPQEIKCCLKLNLNNQKEGIRDEIKSFIKVNSEKVVSFRRYTRTK